MSGPVMPDSSDRSRDEPARAKRRAGLTTFQTVFVLAMGAVVSLSWWSAQVNHFGGTRNRGFIEGDPFPWFLVVPILGLGLWLATRAIRQWVHYTRMTRS